jgi:hypothetical protein
MNTLVEHLSLDLLVFVLVLLFFLMDWSKEVRDFLEKIPKVIVSDFDDTITQRDSLLYSKYKVLSQLFPKELPALRNWLVSWVGMHEMWIKKLQEIQKFSQENHVKVAILSRNDTKLIEAWIQAHKFELTTIDIVLIYWNIWHSDEKLAYLPTNTPLLADMNESPVVQKYSHFHSVDFHVPWIRQKMNPLIKRVTFGTFLILLPLYLWKFKKFLQQSSCWDQNNG